jgi:hypothetical protein
MAKIIEKNKKKRNADMHLHIDRAYDLLKDRLPENYVTRVLQKCNDKTLTSGIVRNIKLRITKYPSSRIAVLNALVELANEYQLECDKMKELTN